MIYSFEAIVQAEFEHQPGWPKSLSTETSINLRVSKNLNKDAYLEKGLPTKDGAKCITATLILGLLSNIKHCHAKGYRDESEHIRYIIEMLEKGFVTDAETLDATFNDPSNFK